MADFDVPDRGPAVFAVTTATLALSTVFVAARMVSRIFILRRVGWDDYTMVLAWLFALGVSLSIDVGTRYGLGKHDADVPLEHKDTLKRCEYVFTVLYNPALMATKSSILIFYLHLSKNIHKVLRYASWAVLVVVNLAGTILTLVNIFQCTPIRAAFETVNGPAKCFPLLTVFICSAPINIVTDLAILALPLPVLTGLRLPQRQKVILIITYTVGIFVTIVDVIRIYYLQEAITDISTSLSSDPKSIFGDSPQFQWNASLALMWSAVEVNVGITCACVPVLKPLIIMILPIMVVDPNGTQTSSESRNHELLASGGRMGIRAPSPGYRETPHNSEMTAVDFTTPDNAKAKSQSLGPNNLGEMSTAADSWETPDAPEPNHSPEDRHQTMDPASFPTSTSSTTTARTVQENPIYFGFVNMKTTKSLLRVSASESFRYCTIVTILFLLWGFSYGLLNALNNAVATTSHMSTAMTLGFAVTYFSGYFFGPLVLGEWILRYDERYQSVPKPGDAHPEGFGFKATFIVSLCIYGTGAIMFWPSAVLASFTGFIISNFVVGCGLGVLQTGISPFIVLCGPPEHAEMRLLVAQGFQSTGSVLSGYLANYQLFNKLSVKEHPGSTRLLNLQWTYLAITLLCAALAIFFYYIPLPEVSNVELEKTTSRLAVDNKKRSVGGLRLQTVCLALAVIALWTFVAAYESMSQFLGNLLLSVRSTRTDSPHPSGLSQSWLLNYFLIANSVYAASRFFAGLLAYLSVKYPRCRLIPRPVTVLALSTAGCILFSILIVSIKPRTHPHLMLIPVVFFYFFEGPTWPLLFALGLRGQGNRTKRAGIFLTMSSSGPTVWLFVVYGILQGSGNVQIALVVNIALLTVTLAYPLYICFSQDARALINPASKEGRRTNSYLGNTSSVPG